MVHCNMAVPADNQVRNFLGIDIVPVVAMLLNRFHPQDDVAASSQRYANQL